MIGLGFSSIHDVSSVLVEAGCVPNIFFVFFLGVAGLLYLLHTPKAPSSQNVGNMYCP